MFLWTLLSHIALMALLCSAAYWVLHFSEKLLLCLGGLLGIGAYTVAILVTSHGIPPVVSICLGGVLAAVAGAILGYVHTKVRGAGFILFMLAAQLLLEELVFTFRSLTHGSNGIDGIRGLVEGGFRNRAIATLTVSSVFAFLSMVGIRRLSSSPFGLTVRAYASDSKQFKEGKFSAIQQLTFVYAMAGLFCGVAGGLQATLTNYVTPGDMGFSVSVAVAVAMLLPGKRWLLSIWLPAIGACSVVAIRNIFDFAFGRFLPSEATWFWHAQVLKEAIIGGLLLWLLIPRRMKPRSLNTDVPKIETEELLSCIGLAASPVANGISSKVICALENVCVELNEQVLVEPTSVSISSGTVTAFVGPNGSGKTTVLRILNREVAPTGGKFDGCAASQVCLLGGSTTLFPGLSVLENLRLHIAPKTHGLLRSLIDPSVSQADAEEILFHLGMSKKATEYGVELSWGQNRRIAICCRLASRSSLLYLFDEPTNGLDTGAREFLLIAMRRLAERGHAVIVVEHDLEFARGLADAVVDFSRQDAQDSHAQIAAVATAPPVNQSKTSLLRTNDLCVGYRGSIVLRDANLLLGPGDIVLLRGRNGSGKSTLLRTLSGQQRGISGTINCALSLGAGGIAYVGETMLFDEMTVGQNLGEADRLGAGIPEVARTLNGWRICQNLWNRRSGTLSLGEKRWLRIMMAVCQNPKVLLMDEPSANLSSAALNELVEDITTLTASTHLGVIVADHVISPWISVARHCFVAENGLLRNLKLKEARHMNAPAIFSEAN